MSIPSDSDVIFTKISADIRKDVGITTADSLSAICEKLRSMTDSFSDAQYEFRNFRLEPNEDLFTVYRRL